MKRFSLLLVVIMVIVLTGCQIVETEEYIEVKGIVTEIQYKESYVTFLPVKVGKTSSLIPQTHPEQYLVTITYENLSKTIDDSTLYENVKEGDTNYESKNVLGIK